MGVVVIFLGDCDGEEDGLDISGHDLPDAEILASDICDFSVVVDAEDGGGRIETFCHAKAL